MVRVFLFSMVLAFGCISTVLGGEDLRIKGLRETHSADLIHVGSNWVKDPKRLQVTLRAANDTPATTITLRAYFYDKDGKEVARAEEPNAVWAQTGRGMQEVGLPSTLEKNKDIEVFFAVTQEIESKKWKSVVVVLDDGKTASARSLPTSALATLSFPGKDRMAKEEKVGGK